MLDVLKDTGFDVVLQQDSIHSLEGTLEGRYLLHDVRAVLLFFNHPDDAVEVSPDRLESVERGFLVYFLHARQSTPPGEGCAPAF